ncbi:short-chain dehydrogenase [Candidatus Peregrinibacteria bacterium CG10_big_fil_rev_8_21_14_0_10_42_8]|nr:MAG: short-chain dehydrogenase [Candidatus Peregrinibacteria bacterium CG10_big_fil_rev_8_21_14_0_10_42_8]
MITLQNKIIVVAGGQGLLGKAFVGHCKEAGATVLSVDVEGGDMHIDIGNEDSITKCFAQILSDHGHIDGLINSAFPRTDDWRKSPGEISAADWCKNIDMHLTGYFLTSRAALEAMKERKSGSVINIGSIYGVNGPDYRIYGGDESLSNPVTYGAIKGGVITMSKHLAAYYGRYNLRVNCISPGGVLDSHNHPGAFVENYSARVPLGRMANPDDVAPAAVYLLSDSASYVTGENMMVDGGWSAV